MKRVGVHRPWANCQVPLYGGDILLYRKRPHFDHAVQAFSGSCDAGPAAGMCVQLEHESGNVVYLIGWFNGGYATLIHELTHATIFICTRAGINVTDSQGEPAAYLIGELWDLLKPERSVRRRK